MLQPPPPLIDQRFVTGTVACAAQKNLGVGDAALASNSGYATHGIALAAAPKSVAKSYGPPPDNVALQVMGVAAVTAENKVNAQIRYRDGFAVDFATNALGTTLGKHQTLLHPVYRYPNHNFSAKLVFFHDEPALPTKQPVTDMYHPRDLYNMSSMPKAGLGTLTDYTSNKTTMTGGDTVKFGVPNKNGGWISRVVETVSVDCYPDKVAPSAKGSLKTLLDEYETFSVGQNNISLIKYYNTAGTGMADGDTIANPNVVHLKILKAKQHVLKEMGDVDVGATMYEVAVYGRRVNDAWIFYGATGSYRTVLHFHNKQMEPRECE